MSRSIYYLDAFWHTRPCSLLQQNRYLRLIDWMQNTPIWDWNQPHPFKKEEGGMEHLFINSPRIFLEMSACPDPRAGGWSCLLHPNPGMRLSSGSEEASRMASSIQGNPPFLILYRLLGYQTLAFFYTKQHQAFSTFSRVGSEAVPLHIAISGTRDKSIFMGHYQESLFFTKITRANEHVGWEWGGSWILERLVGL